MFNWVDVGIIGIIVVSTAISVFRGFFRETLSLLAWILAAWVGWRYAPYLALKLSGLISSPVVQKIAAGGLLFVATLMLAGWVNYLIIRVIRKTGLSGSDRMLGVFFGGARGVLIVALFIMLGQYLELSAESWWGESRLLIHFESVTGMVKDFAAQIMAQAPQDIWGQTNINSAP